LGEDRSLPFVRLEKKVGCCGEKLVFCVFAKEQVKGMPDAGRVDAEDGLSQRKERDFAREAKARAIEEAQWA
jgi:hypothetical protein